MITLQLLHGSSALRDKDKKKHEKRWLVLVKYSLKLLALIRYCIEPI